MLVGIDVVYAVIVVISLTITVYFLFVHIHQFYVEFGSKNAATRHPKVSNDGHHLICILLFSVIVMQIVYYSLKLTWVLNQTNSNCKIITTASHAVATAYIWLTELFFLIRGWGLLQEMKRNTSILGLSENSFMIYDVMCRIGVVFSSICLIANAVFVIMFLRYELRKRECVSTMQYTWEVGASAYSMMGCCALVGIIGLVSFAWPLHQYSSVLGGNVKTHSRVQSETNLRDEAEESKVEESTVATVQRKNSKNGVQQKKNRIRISLRRTIVRVCICLICVHLLFFISGVVCVVTASSQRTDVYGSLQIYRSLYCVCSILMIVSMDLTFNDWRQRLIPWKGFWSNKMCDKRRYQSQSK